MNNHLQNLKSHTPDISRRRILDVGAGRGNFLIDCAVEGIEAVGLEFNPSYVDIATTKANKIGLSIQIIQGEAENMPFEEKEFGFVNCSEVTEHVQDLDLVLKNIYEVLESGGRAYISFHNRFGLYDTHFHLYFLGWMPRKVSEKYIVWRNKTKNYKNMPDLQRLSEMHYVKYGQIKRKLQKLGFQVVNLRERKLSQKTPTWMRGFALWLLRMIQPVYFSTFHFLVIKP